MSDLVIRAIEQWGYFGIAVLMLLENVFPPVPSELIMPFAGYVAATGKLHIAGVIAAGSLGSLLGTLPWFWLGHRIGRERLRKWVGHHGRWFTMDVDDLDRAERWMKRHGGWALLFGRLVPTVRSVISMPAGVARMPLGTVLAWSAVGTAAWTALLAGLGYALESRFESIQPWVDKASTAVVVALVATYLWRVIRFKPASG